MNSTEVGMLSLLKDQMQGWNPEIRDIHCSNCLHAKVSGEEHSPLVRCDKGHYTGKRDLPLIRMIAAKNPLSFRSAILCPDFTSMSS